MKNLQNRSPNWFFRLLNKIGNERRYQVSFGVASAGLIMIVISHLLDSHAELHLARTVLLEIGIACIIAAIAEFLLLKHASELFRQEVQEDIKLLDGAVATLQQQVCQDMKMLEQADETFRQEVRQDMKILSHCLEHQLVDVLPPLNKAQAGLAAEVIRAVIENARDEVRIIAFTLRDILNDEESLAGPLQLLLKGEGNVSVKLLLIDPTSAAAHIRFMAEEKPETTFKGSMLVSALRETFYGIEKMMKGKGGLKIEARFYNILPSFYMVSTPDEVFIAPCHLGRRHNGEGSTNGGVVPLLRFSSRSQMYKFAQSHFSYIWDNQKENTSDNGKPQNNGCIEIKTMDKVGQEINRRSGESERRNETSQVKTEKRSTDRRETTPVKVMSTAAGSTIPH